MNTIAIDTETYYSKTYTIKDLGNYGYTHHKEFDPYLLTAAVTDGDWCGKPEEFPWAEANGQIWIMANAGFDLAVIDRLVELERIPAVKPFAIYDVLDLARYLGYPGNLAAASEHMLGVVLDKGTRNSACGRYWKDFTPEQQEAMKKYAVRDATSTLQLWEKYGDQWPEWERKLSQMTRDMCRIGVPMDAEAVKNDIEQLEILLWKVRSKIPWNTKDDAKILSRKEFSLECRKHNVEPPKSMAKDSEEFSEWLRSHGDRFAWAKAIGSYRSMNMLLAKLKSMLARSTPEGNLVYGLKYAGAHTLRDSGDAGVNVQNFPRQPMFVDDMKEQFGPEAEGIDLRGKLLTPPGFTFGISDLSAIEPCVLAFFAGDWDMVGLLNKGMDPYEAWARVHHNYTDPRPLKEVDSKMRQLCKVEVLGLGYGAGPDKLIVIAQQLAGLTISESESKRIVANFRATKFIPALWSKLEDDMRKYRGQDWGMQLPSGRTMHYRKVQALGSLSAVIPRNGRMMRLKFWGGTLCENLVQSTARDILMHHAIEVNKAGYNICLRVHDELVTVLPETSAKDDLQKIITIMSTSPSWGSDIPVRAEGFLSNRYRK